MDGLLEVASTRKLSRHEDQIAPVAQSKPTSTLQGLEITSPEEALQVLKSQPDIESLKGCLRWLARATNLEDGVFNIKVPSPKAAQVLNTVVNEVVPHYWPVLRPEKRSDNGKERNLLLGCLTSVAGIGALATRLKSLLAAGENNKEHPKGTQKENSIGPLVETTLEVLDQMLKSDKAITRMLRDLLQYVQKPAQRTLVWKELISWLATGRLLSIAAEARLSLDTTVLTDDASWLTDGKAYSSWLGRNIKALEPRPSHDFEEATKLRALMLGKALSLGYRDGVIGAIFSDSLAGETQSLASNRALVLSLPPHDQKVVLYGLLRILAGRSTTLDSQKGIVGGAAALVHALLNRGPNLMKALADWLTDTSGGGIGVDLSIHRAVIVVLSANLELLQNSVKRILATFGDKLYIQHNPVLHQEVCAQDLLLFIGQLWRKNPSQLKEVARSSSYINAISNRLAASSPRSQFLGMVVGMSVSELLDTPEKRMNFDIEELDNDDGRWYRSLTSMVDTVGSISDLKGEKSDHTREMAKESPAKAKTPRFNRAIQTQSSKIVAIEEIEDDEDKSDSDDDGLPTYEKPDSDEEDEDDDPTLVQRNKPTAPVYIRDLIAGLKDSENYDRHTLAVSTGADLIRRKANFGTEVSDHIEELAAQFLGLRDTFNLDKFEEMRLRAMIAVVVARPLQMGKWYSNALFNGDYSMSQRASILSALSMAARDLAGYRQEDAALTGAYTDPKDLFPSKRLPAKLDKAFAIEAAPINALTEKLERTLIKPMAAAAADQLSGPSILKVRTFSSRMEVEKKRKRPITNELAKIVSEGFFFPLTGRYSSHMQVHGSRTSFSTPFLLAHFLKTLALILSASGSSTLSLPALTTEFWAFLLPLRGEALQAQPVLEALLFCFLTLLEINANDLRQVAEDHPKELLETQAWVQQVFDNIRGGEKEGERARMLAASVLVRCSEVVEKYQRLMMGDLVNYM